MKDYASISNHTYFDINNKGTDYFVGDMHGKYDLFINLLNYVDFNPDCDRVFSVGDVIDRGERSFDCLSLARDKWFFPILGNHEKFLLDCDELNDFKMSVWYRNGGSWWKNLSKADKSLARNIILTEYSLTISVQTEVGLVGLVHAEYPLSSWPVSESETCNEVLKKMLWGRDEIYSSLGKVTESIDLIVSGHTPMDDIVFNKNRFFIDTGSGYSPSEALPNPKLTMVNFECESVNIYSSFFSGVSCKKLEL
ncbi:metallophosphoesterase [Enterovibrio baiacu]|uniref:metallophosphoesterase n=1 Tax=Enterovibrio baiacu TaxID=2491023 RepID=UPI003D14F2D9